MTDLNQCNSNQLQPPNVQTDSVVLLCPKCLGKLHVTDLSLICQKCDRQFRVSYQIPVLADDPSFYYKFARMDRAEFRELLNRIDCSGFVNAMNMFLAESGEAVSNSFFRNTFDLGRVAWKYTLKIPENAVALDLGCGAGVASMGLAPHCKQVVGYDMTLERVAFLQRWAAYEGLTNVRCICGGDDELLPFENRTFDIVVLNGVLEWVAGGRSGSPIDCQTRFLREVRRILKPNGQLYVGIENRIGYQYFFGKKEDHTGIRFLNLMPRFLASIVHQVKRKTPYRVYTHSRRGLDKLLQACGFLHNTFYSPFPDYRHFRQIAPLDGRTQVDPPTSRWKIKTLIHRFACRPKVLRHFSPTFGVIASPAPGDNSLLKELMTNLDLSRSVTPLLISKTGVTIIHAITQDEEEVIVRLPHSTAGKKKCETNVRRLKEIHSDTAVPESFKRCVPKLVSSTIYKGQLATVETKIPGTSLKSLADKHLDRTWASLVSMLMSWNHAVIEANRAADSLLRADMLRSRVSAITRLIPNDSTSKVLSDFLIQIETELSELHVSSVQAHGDCHPGNVLVDRNTREVTGLVDWDTAIPNAPPLFDLLNFIVWTEHDGDLKRGLFPLRTNVGWKKDLDDIVQRLALPADYITYLQKFYVLWRITDRLDEPILHQGRVGRSMQLLKWFHTTQSAALSR